MAPDCVFTFVSRAFGFLNFIFWTPFFDREGPGGRPRRFGTDRLPVETGSTAFFTFLSSTIGSFEGGFRIELNKIIKKAVYKRDGLSGGFKPPDYNKDDAKEQNNCIKPRKTSL